MDHQTDLIVALIWFASGIGIGFFAREILEFVDNVRRARRKGDRK